MERLENEMIELAKAIATTAHTGQFRKFGQREPYINHPKRVANFVKQYVLDSPTLIHYSVFEVVGWLHDSVEDSPLTFEELKACGFSQDIVDAIDALSKRKGENYFEFIKRCMVNEIATYVKIADLTDNSSDLNEGSMKDKYRLAKYILELEIK